MKAEKIDWTFFKKRILIESAAEKIYSAWSTKENIETWFLQKADFVNQNSQTREPAESFQKGDCFIWKWHNWDFEEKGEILEANGIDKISFTFGSGGVVDIELVEKNSFTEVLLTQREIPTDEKSKKEIYVGCETGWTFWLTNLKAWIEHGITLHAKGLAQSETKHLVNS